MDLNSHALLFSRSVWSAAVRRRFHIGFMISTLFKFETENEWQKSTWSSIIETYLNPRPCFLMFADLLRSILALLLTPFFLFGEDGLQILEFQVKNELAKVGFPPSKWIIHSDKIDVLDVAIVGGGMAGMTAAFALMKEGILNIKIFDENPLNQEGLWIKYARMNELRSGKQYLGPALGIPSLTFWSWYEAQYGKESWNKLKLCPTKLWHDYLCWYRRVLNLPLESKMTLTKLKPVENFLELTFVSEGLQKIVYSRKVVLATGREGAGGHEIPKFFHHLPKRFYAHTGERIDPCFFKNKRIAVIGAGSSAFDAAAVALENGAEAVEMLVRRSSISQINKFGQFSYPGLENGFYLLPDDIRCLFFMEALKEGGIDPSKAAVERIKDFSNFHVHYDTLIQNVAENNDGVIILTNHNTLQVDYIIVGTGYTVDLSKRPELDEIRSAILLWRDRIPQDFLQQVPMLGNFPYLGPHFQFLESNPGNAPYLKDIYCFNYGAFLSHALLSGDIPGISFGATRLARGIASDFFLDETKLYVKKIRDWITPDFNSSDYLPLRGIQ